MTSDQYLARLDPASVAAEAFPPWRSLGRGASWQSLPPDFEARSTWARIAFHEAGHALLFAAIGMAIRELALVPEPVAKETGIAGVVHFARRESAPVGDDEFGVALRQVPRFAVGIAAGHLAGVMAEVILEGVMLHGAVAEYSSPTDMSNAVKFLAPLCLSNAGGMWFAQRYARSVLTHHWATVARVAEALLEHRTLRENALHALIGTPPKLRGLEVKRATAGCYSEAAGRFAKS